MESSADYFSGNDLLKFLDADATAHSNKDHSMQVAHWSGVARGYIAGVSDAYNGWGWFCAPPNAELDQAVALVARYLKEHPDKWHLPGKQIVLDTLSSHFPCKR